MEVNTKFGIGDKVFNIYDQQSSQDELGDGIVEEVVIQVRYKVRFRKDSNKTYKCFEDELVLFR